MIIPVAGTTMMIILICRMIILVFQIILVIFSGLQGVFFCFGPAGHLTGMELGCSWAKALS